MFTEKWIPESIAECLHGADYHTFPEYYEEWDIEGTLVYWNPHNLGGFFPPEMFDNKFTGDWNVPFIMRVLFVNNWQYILDLFSKSDRHETTEACCAMCTDRCFNLGDHKTYTVAAENYDWTYKGFYMCENSTKDNFHVLCTDCFTQLMVDRGTTFSKNPKCPCCRTVPNLWLAFTYDSAYDAQELPIRWMKEFYARLLRHIDWDDIQFLHRYGRSLSEQVQAVRVEREVDRTLIEAQVTSIQGLHERLEQSQKDADELREKYRGAMDQLHRKDQELLHYRIVELQKTGLVPSILGKRKGHVRVGRNVRLTIKKKMESLNNNDFIE
jgi:hypothetical protein